MNHPKTHTSHNTSVLLISVPTAQGFIPAFGRFCESMGVDIVRLEEQRLNDSLYLRCEFRFADDVLAETVVGEPLSGFLSGYDATAQVTAKRAAQSVAIVIGKHSPILERILVGVVGRLLDTLGIAFIAAMDVDSERIANRYGIPFFTLPKKDGLALEDKCSELFKRYRPDFIGVAGVEHVFSAAFQAQTTQPLFGVQSGFVSVASGSPRIQFDFEWARERGARIMVGSSFYYSAEVSEHRIIHQQARVLETAVSDAELNLIHSRIEASLFLDTLEKVSDARVLQDNDRCIVF